jgi:uncharacterized protein (TIGR03437 family)
MNLQSEHLIRTRFWPYISLIPVICGTGLAQVNLLTANGGNDRTNANLQETQLTPANITLSSFGKLASFPVDGQVYSQTLYVSGLSFPASGIHNVVFVSTMHNSVYAFDGDSFSPPRILWHVNLGPSVPSSLVYDTYRDISPEIGILGTGVIDLQGGALYVVSETVANGAPAFYLHALDLTSGAEKMKGPVAIQATFSAQDSTGSVLAPVSFDPQQHLQRPGLLFANGAIYIAFGSHADTSPWHGWLMSYDASDITKQLGVFLTTPSDNGGAIWQSGRGLAADDTGNVYMISGNGGYDGVQNFAESFLKLAGATPALADWFTPADWQDLDDMDADLSAGPALIPGTHTVIGGDKNGQLYLISGDAMGKLSEGTTGASRRISDVVQGRMFNLAIWAQPQTTYIYVQGVGDAVKCYQLTGGQFNASPVSETSATVDNARVGMTISANGSQDGILWETTGDFGDPAVPATLHALDASDLSHELWNSAMNPNQDAVGGFAKFANPSIANGKVYVPTLSGTVAVFGLLNGVNLRSPRPVISAVENAASYAQNAISPGEVITIFGWGLAGATATAQMQENSSGLVETALSDTLVLFDGLAGPVLYASAVQVNAMVPFAPFGQSTQVQVQYQQQLSDPVNVAVVPTTPGVFSADSSGTGQGLILNSDGTANSQDNPATRGSTVTLYLTGVGQTSPTGQDGATLTSGDLPQPVASVSAQIGGQPTQVLGASGVPDMVTGIVQVKLQIPPGSPCGPSVSLVVQVGGNSTQAGLTVAIQREP